MCFFRSCSRLSIEMSFGFSHGLTFRSRSLHGKILNIWKYSLVRTNNTNTNISEQSDRMQSSVCFSYIRSIERMRSSAQLYKCVWNRWQSNEFQLKRMTVLHRVGERERDKRNSNWTLWLLRVSFTSISHTTQSRSRELFDFKPELKGLNSKNLFS